MTHPNQVQPHRTAISRMPRKKRPVFRYGPNGWKPRRRPHAFRERLTAEQRREAERPVWRA